MSLLYRFVKLVSFLEFCSMKSSINFNYFSTLPVEKLSLKSKIKILFTCKCVGSFGQGSRTLKVFIFNMNVELCVKCV